MGKADFRGSADKKPLDRSISNFEHITAVLTSCYKPIFITIAPRGSSAQYGEVAHFLFASCFFTSCHVCPPERAGGFRCLVRQTTSFATRKIHLGVSLNEIFARNLLVFYVFRCS
jgi:hypothetical protein